MAYSKPKKMNIAQIKEMRDKIEGELSKTLTEEGTIDLIKLSETNQSLAEVFDVITLSKTWRDDPRAFAKDVARMMSARDNSSTLGTALQKLEAKLGKEGKS